MAFSSGSVVWPAAGGAAADPTTTYTVSTAPIQTTEQEHWLFGRVAVPAGAIADPGLRIRVDVSLDYNAATGMAAATWVEFSRVDIPNLTSDPAAITYHDFEIELPQRCTARLAVRDMGGDADTTLTVLGWLRASPIGHGRNGQPLALRAVQSDMGVLAWHDAGAAQAVGVVMSVSNTWSWIPVGEATELEILATTTGGPPTSVEMQVQETLSDVAAPAAGTIAGIPAVNSVTAGNVNQYPAYEQIQSAAGTLADGTYVSRRISVTPGSLVRLRAQRTGAAVNMIAYLRLFKVPAE